MESQTVKWGMERRNQLKKKKFIAVVRKGLEGKTPQPNAQCL